MSLFATMSGLLVNYEGLPGIVARVLLPIFKVKPTKRWLEKMEAVASFYSKGKGTEKIFKEDSNDKDTRATQLIQQYASSILMPTYERMTEASWQGLQRAAPAELVKLGSSYDRRKDWKSLSTIIQSDILGLSIEKVGNTINVTSIKTQPSNNSAALLGHSNLPVITYLPWSPFSNTHSSTPFQVDT